VSVSVDPDDFTNQRVLGVMAAPGTLEAGITRAYEDAGRLTHAEQTRDIQTLAQELVHDMPAAAIVPDGNDVITETSNVLVRLVNQMIEDAVRRLASDIHVEFLVQQNTVRIRFRVDGTLMPYLELPPRYHRALVARIKIMSDLDISERRKPQDGKIDFSRFGGSSMELRVVTVPTAHGYEDVVLRLLAGAKPLPLPAIGLSDYNLEGLRQSITKPYGLVLICGPTGCGKTTTLHSVLRDLNDGERKIWIHCDFSTTGKLVLYPDAASFASARRQLQLQQSLGGGVQHALSAAESVARLLEMGLDPFNFSDSLLAVLGQRLVRRLCPDCRRAQPASSDDIDALMHEYLHSAHDNPTVLNGKDALLAEWRHIYGDEDGRLRLWRKQGCGSCGGRGYKGRLGLQELLLSDEVIRQQIRRRASASDILQSGLNAGMRTLRQDGIDKVLRGLTDMNEVISASNM